MTVPVFEIKDVTYEYKDKLEATPALQHISFSINQGEFLAIVGPNGSGKSTLLKLILGVYKLQQGNILINGKSRKSFNAWQEIGYVSQKAAAHAKGFPATVEEVVLSGLTKEKGLFKRFNKKDNKQLDKTLKLLDIEHIKHQNVSNLSGGRLSGCLSHEL